MALYDKAKGRSFQKIYKRIGIRRDQNFSDLSNPTRGLENLLDTLVDDTSFKFLSTDLAAIKNIFSRGLTNGNYLNIAGSSIKFTTQNGVTVSFDPRITYQNRIDKIKIFTGEPRLAGGNGLTAKYFQNDQINFNEHSEFKYNVDPNNQDSSLDSSTVFVSATNEGAIEDDTFWEAGNFSYTENVHPQSAKANTGVKWEGYFIPTVTGKVNFTVDSTGYFTADFQQVGYQENNNGDIISSGIGTYKEEVRVGLTTFIPNINGAANTNQITVSGAANLEKMNTIGIGMTVVLSSKIATNTVIESFNKETGVISLIPPAGTPNAVTQTFSNQTVEFNRVLGTNIRHTFPTQVLIAYERYRIRFRYFHHRNFDSKDIQRSFGVDYKQTNFSATTHLRYNNLFPLEYDFKDSAKGDFNNYFDNSVRFGGTNIHASPFGLGSRTNTSKYVKIKSQNKVDITYKVKQELGSDTGSKTRGITRRELACTLTNGSRIIPIDLTTDIEIGNYVFGTGIPNNTRVIDITINQFIIVDNASTVDGSETLAFINHRGFVKRVLVKSVSGNTIDVNTSTPLRASTQNATTIDTDVQKDMIAIGSGINAIQITGISAPSTSNGGQLTLASNVSASQDDPIYIYQSRGLKDNSLQTFCSKFLPDNQKLVQCLVSTNQITQSQIDAGVNTIVVDDVGVAAQDWNIQGFNFASGTKITNITGNTITLSQNIERLVVQGTQFTATSDSNDRQLCCPPTDTSPPFTASEEGLNTDSVSPRPNLRLESGNLIFDSLIIQDTNSNASNASPSDTVNRKINIRTNVDTNSGTGKNYKLLAFESP